jgi:hypothetical protein
MNALAEPLIPEQQLSDFIARWTNAGGSERANYQLFLTELCALLGLPQPEPAGENHERNAFMGSTQ